MKRKPSKSARSIALWIIASHLGSFLAPALANPEGGSVAAGSATINSTPGVTNIHQTSDRAVINWQSFSNAAGESIRFNQPTSRSVALNRVVGVDPSTIDGALSANGKVFLLNPNGIVFGKTSQVNTGGLVASTLEMSDGDFMAGKYNLNQAPGKPQAGVVNQGQITAADGVALIAPIVNNQGKIVASRGEVVLAGSTRAVVNFDNDGALVNVAVPKDVGSRGDVKMARGTASDFLKKITRAPGVQEATELPGEDGSVTLRGAEGIAVNEGTIIARDASGNGGGVQILGTRAAVLSPTSLIDASGAGKGHGGTVLIRSEGKVLAMPESRTLARGGEEGGDGGFIDLSAPSLDARGVTSAGASNGGKPGTVLYDPRDIVITDAANGTSGDDTQLDDNVIQATDSSGSTFTIDDDAIEARSNDGIDEVFILEASGSIQFNNNVSIRLFDNDAVVFRVTGDQTGSVFNGIRANTGAVTLTKNNLASTGSITFDVAQGAAGVAGEINLSAMTINGGAGNINISTPGFVTLNQVTTNVASADLTINAGAVTQTLAAQGSITGTAGNNLTGRNLFLRTLNPVGNVGDIAGNQPLNFNTAQLTLDNGGARGAKNAFLNFTGAGDLTVDTVRVGAVAGDTLVLHSSNGIVKNATGLGIIGQNVVLSASAAKDIGTVATPLPVTASSLSINDFAGGAGAKDVFIAGTGNVQFGSTIALGTVAATSDGIRIGGNFNYTGTGSITEGGSALGLVVPGTVNLNVGTTNDIGTLANPLRTSVGTLNVGLAASQGVRNAFISNGVGLTLGTINAGSTGTVALTAGGTITDAGNDALINVIAGDLTLTATAGAVGASGTNGQIETDATTLTASTPASGGIFVNEIDTTGTNGLGLKTIAAGSGNVEIVSARAITDAGNDAAANITAADLVITATTGAIGATGTNGQVETDVNSLTATASGAAGGVFVNEIDTATGNGVAIKTVTGGAAGNVEIVSARAITDFANDGAVNVTGNDVALSAAIGAIGVAGTAGQLETASTSLTAIANGTGGGVFINEITAGVALKAVDGGVGNVELVAAGAITDFGNDALVNVTGADVVINATTGAIGATGTNGQIETAATSLTATASGAGGGVFVNEITGGVAVKTVDAGAGNVELASAGAITDFGNDALINVTGTDVVLSASAGAIGSSGTNGQIETASASLSASANGAGGGVFVNEITGGVAIKTIDAGAGNAELVSAGAITDFAADALINVTANDLVLTATAGAIGATGTNGQIETSVTSLTATANTGGGVFVNEISGGVAIKTIDAGAGNVELVSAAGITDFANDAAQNITAADLIVTAVTGAIGATGTAGQIETSVTSLTATASGAGGGVFINEITGGVAVKTINAGTGNAELASAGAITDFANDAAINVSAADFIVSATTGAIGATGTNGQIETDVTSLTATATGAAGGVFVNEIDTVGVNGVAVKVVDAGTGNVELVSARAITDFANDALINVRGADAILTATAGAIGATGTNGQIETDVTSLTATATGAAGGVFVNEIDSNTTDGVAIKTVNGGAGNVEIASARKITDFANDAAINITGNDVALSTIIEAIGATGTNGQLEIASTSLSAVANGAGGGVFLNEITGGVAVKTIDAGTGNAELISAAAITDFAADGLINITANDLIITATTGAIGATGTSGQIETAAVSLTATANGAGGGVFVNEIGGGVALKTVNAGAGNVELIAADAITDFANDALINVTGSDLILATAAGAIGATGTNGQIETAATSLTATANGAGGGVFINEITAGVAVKTVDAGAGNAELIAAGAITDFASDALVNITAADLVLTATSGAIGATGTNGQIETTSTSLTATANGAGGGVFINEITAGVALKTVDAGAGNVEIVAAGSITDFASDALVNITAADLIITATTGAIGASGTGGQIETALTSVTATAAGAGGGVFLNEVTGGVAVKTINAGAGNVELASAGAITDFGNDALVNVTAADLVLSATAGAIGASGTNGQIETDVTSFTGSAAGAGGGVFVNELNANGVALKTVDAGTSSVEIISGGSITDFANDGLINLTAGDAILTATTGSIGASGTNGQIETDVTSLTASTPAGGGIFFNELDTAGANGLALKTINAGTGNVEIASARTITDFGGDAAINITGAGLLITAATGAIGATGTNGQIETDVTTLTAATPAGGGIFLNELDTTGANGIALNTVNAATGNVEIISARAITDNNNDAAINITGAAVTLTATVGAIGVSGTNGQIETDITSLVATATGAGGGVFINELDATTLDGISLGHVNAAASAVEIVSARAILDLANDSAINITAGNLFLTAASESIGATGTAGQIETDVTALTASAPAGGGIFINELDTTGANGIALNTVNAAAGNVEIISARAITDNNNDAAINITGAALTLLATAGSIGASGTNGQIETDVTSLQATASGAGGGVFVNELDATTQNGIGLGAVNAGAGNVEIVSARSITDLGNDALINITGNAANLTATTGSIGAAGTNGQIETDVTSLTAATPAGGGIFVNELDTTGASGIALNTVNAATGDAEIFSARSITDLGNDALINVTAASLTLVATTGAVGAAGTNGQIETDVSRFTGATPGAGGIFINELDTTTLDGLALNTVNAATGNVEIISARSITDRNLDALINITGNAVTLTATTGSIGATGVAGQIETDITSLTASTPGGGGIFINEIDTTTLDGIRIVSLDAGGGALELTSTGSILDAGNDNVVDVRGGNVTLISTTGSVGASGLNGSIDTDVTSLKAATPAGGGIFINEIDTATANGIALDTINAATGNVEIVSARAITDLGNDALINVTGASAFLTATIGAIGASGVNGRIETDVTTLTATATGTGGGVFINEIDTVTLNGVAIATVNAGANNVEIVSARAITDSGNDAAINITAADLILTTTLEAVGASGTNGQLETDVTSLTATAEGTGGGVFINEIDTTGTNGLALKTVSAGAGAVELVSARAITDLANDALINVRAGDLTITALSGAVGSSGTSGQIETDVASLTATASGASGGVFINEIDTAGANGLGLKVVDAGTAVVEIVSARSITDFANDAAVNVIAGDLALAATSGAIGATGTGAQIETDVTSLTATANGTGGGVFVNELDTTTANGLALKTVNAGAGNVELISANAVTDFAGDALINITAADLLMTATAGAIGAVGANGAIETDVTSVTATANGAGGGVFVNELDTTGVNGIALKTVDAGAGNVEIASARAITDFANDALINITAADLTLSAAAGAIGAAGTNGQIETSVATLTATAAGLSGGVFINELAVDGVGVKSIDAGTNSAELVSAGAITDVGNDTTIDVRAGDAALVATVGAIGSTGSAGQIDTDVTTLTASARGAGGGVFVNEVDTAGVNGVGIKLVDAGTNIAELVSARSITDFGNDAVNVDVIAGALSITATTGAIGATGVNGRLETDLTSVNAATPGNGGIFLNEIDTTGANGLALGSLNAGTGNLEIFSARSITDLGNDAALNVSGATLTITAVTGAIGATGTNAQIETDVTSITAAAAGTGGGVFVNELDTTGANGLGLRTINAGAGNIEVVSARSITDFANDATINLTGIQATLTALTGSIGAAGTNGQIETDITSLFAATPGNGGVFVNELDTTGANGLALGTVNAGSGNAQIVSQRSITDLGNDAAVNITAAALSLTATTGSIGSTGSGGRIETDVTSLSANTPGNGGAFIDELDTTTTDGLAIDSINAGVGAVEIVSARSITDLANDAGVNIRGGALSLTATTGSIGSSGVNGQLETDVQTLAAETPGNGGIFINEVDTVGANGLGLNAVNAGTGNVELTSARQITDANGAAVNVTGANLRLLTGAFDVGTSLDRVETAVTSLTIDSGGLAGVGSAFLSEADALLIDTVRFTSTFDLLSGGPVTDNGVAGLFGNTANLNVGVANDIGTAANPLDTTLTTLNVGVGPAARAVFVNELNDLTIGSIETAATGSVTANIGGALQFGLIDTGTFTITSVGSMLDFNAGALNIHSTGAGTLNATGPGSVIGTIEDALEISMGDSLTVNIAGAINGVSGVFTGTLPNGLASLNVNAPASVKFNGLENGTQVGVAGGATVSPTVGTVNTVSAVSANTASANTVQPGAAGLVNLGGGFNFIDQPADQEITSDDAGSDASGDGSASGGDRSSSGSSSQRRDDDEEDEPTDEEDLDRMRRGDDVGEDDDAGGGANDETRRKSKRPANSSSPATGGRASRPQQRTTGASRTPGTASSGQASKASRGSARPAPGNADTDVETAGLD